MRAQPCCGWGDIGRMQGWGQRSKGGARDEGGGGARRDLLYIPHLTFVSSSVIPVIKAS